MAFWRKRKSRTDAGAIVQNWWGFGDGAAIVLERLPDLDRMVSDPYPQAAMTISGVPAKGVSDNPDSIRSVLLIVHLYHPDPAVRATAARLGIDREQSSIGFIDGLVDLTADPDPAVRTTAAKGLWSLCADSNCEHAVKVLRDEIRGHSSAAVGVTTAELRLGKEAAVAALDLLVEHAPDDESRTAVQALIDKYVVIPERVPQASTAQAVFVEKTSRVIMGGHATYLVYRAPDKNEAITFLKTRPVEQELFYIEVETPTATYGRDINGIYEI
jgi:hypothetical protein